ncbi:hypothetical protein DX873_11530 [Flagellimonas nanhaiensis]|uniref:Collagen-like protein n=2 Tax=Flagellimonas nanhaiensis TaxID=2292706 RepID=A0A371JR39_9FLAO|nr:hypothetical protein DX873_11530 [Allomuricauda nanhaiensis]
MALTMVSCSGEDGLDGKNGDSGAPGTPGTNGDDGLACWDLNGNGVGDVPEDVNDDGNFDALDCQGTEGLDGADKPNMDFYFQDGFKGYMGTVDAGIIPPDLGTNDEEMGLLYINNGQISERRAVLRFDGIGEAIAEALVEEGEDCSNSFYMSKATLYIYIATYTNVYYDNLSIKVGFYGDQDPFFAEDEATWTAANVNDDWGDIGGESEQWAGPLQSDDYPSLLPRGSGVTYGWFPILLPRSVVEDWICNPETNKGMRLRIEPGSDELGQGTIDIVTSDNLLEDFRPLLVIETEDIEPVSANKGAVGTSKPTDWESMTYEEKMAPLYRFLSLK